MNYRGLELKLCEIVEKRLEEGWELWSGGGKGMLSTDGHCCLMGAVAHEKGVAPNSDSSFTPGENIRGAAASLLGIERREAWHIEAGFEKWEDEPRDAFYRIGARIRRRYFETA